MKIYDALAPIFGGLSIEIQMIFCKDGGEFTVNIDNLEEGEELEAIEKAESALKAIGATDFRHGESRRRVWVVGNI